MSYENQKIYYSYPPFIFIFSKKLIHEQTHNGIFIFHFLLEKKRNEAMKSGVKACFVYKLALKGPLE